MTTYPKQPRLQAPAAIADQGRRVTRLEGSRDQMVSTLNQVGPQAATALSTATSASSGVSAINTRLGTADFSVLANLSEMPNISSATGTTAHSGIGTVSGTVTAAEYNALNTAYNNLADTVSTLQSKYNSLLSELVSGGYMHS